MSPYLKAIGIVFMKGDSSGGGGGGGATEHEVSTDARGGYGSYATSDTVDSAPASSHGAFQATVPPPPEPTVPPAPPPETTPVKTNQKPGEDNQAQAQSQTSTSITDLAKAAKEADVPLSALLGLGLSSSDKLQAGLYGGNAGTEPTYNQLKALQLGGYGTLEGVNPNNLTGQNVDNMLASRTAGKVIGNIGNLAVNAAINAVPGMSVIKPVVNSVMAYKNGMSPTDIAGNVAMDIGTKALAGDINRALPSVIGPDAASTLNRYNQVGSLVNTFSPGTIPGVNVGALGANYAKDAINALAKDQGWTKDGWNGLSNYVGVPLPKTDSGPAGSMTDPTGSVIPDVQPWHGGHSSGFSTNGPLTTTAATAPTAVNNLSTILGAYDPDALRTHALQVYGTDSVFKPGERA